MVEIEERLDRLIRDTWDSHLDVLALLMGENSIGRDEQLERLESLVICFRNRVLEDTIFEDGRRVPTSLEVDGIDHTLRINAELLSRVDDGEILFAFARPIAQILGISPLSVSLALQTRDEKALRNLSNKAVRSLDSPPVRSIEVPAYLADKMAMFSTRLATVSASLGGTTDGLQIEPSDAFRETLQGSTGWPDWVDVKDALGGLVEALTTALEGAACEESAEDIAEMLWDGLGVGSQSFLRNAGRSLRAANSPCLLEILAAFSAAAAATDSGYSDQLASWANLTDLHDAWTHLNQVEETVFGVSTVDPERKPVSMLVTAKRAFGIDEPDSLPWDLPVVCWSTREQGALRDLFVGVSRTLPSAADHEFFAFEDIWRPEESALEVGTEGQRGLGVQVVATGMELVTPEPEVWARAWSACARTLLQQFDALPEAHQEECNRMLHKAYDDYFPEAKAIWARRFYNLHTLGRRDAFEQLMTEVQHLLNAPVVFDPFVRPTVGEMAPFPTLTFAVAMTQELQKAPIWIPLSALASTIHGAPIRVRAVEVSPNNGACQWLCDRSLHLNKLQNQPVDLIVRSVHGDALQFAIFE